MESFPTFGTEFVPANKPNEPGWGAWTISRIAGGWEDAAANFIWHSYGNVGVSQDSTILLNNRSWVKSYFTVGDVPNPITMVNFKAAKADSGVMCTGATPVASNKCVIA